MISRYRLDERRFKKALSARGMENLARFAETFHLNRATIHHYLKGQGPLSEAYYQLCEALQVDPLELLVPLPRHENLDHQAEIAPLVKALTAGHSNLAVGLLGSRARVKAKKYSDWDLGVTGGAATLGEDECLKLKVQLGELTEDLPRFVDLINLDRAPIWFLKEMDYEPIFLGGNPVSWNYFLGVLHATQKGA